MPPAIRNIFTAPGKTMVMPGQTPIHQYLRLFLSALFFVGTLEMLPAAVFADSTSGNEAMLLRQAHDLYTGSMDAPEDEAEKMLRRSASLYGRLAVEKGIRNGYLYYNIGNCHLRLGELGTAIYYYRKAEILLPQFKDLRENLRTAEGQRRDKAPRGQLASVWRTLFFWHFLAGLRTRVFLFAGFYLAGWVALIARFRYRRPVLKVIAFLSLFFSAVFFLSVSATALTLHYSNAGVLVTDQFEARTGPGESYDPAFTGPLHDGCEFEKIGSEGGWLEVELQTGDKCWIRNDREVARLIRE